MVIMAKNMSKHKQCPLLDKCREATGINCANRNFDGSQKHVNSKWLGKEPCAFYSALEREKKPKPIKKQRRKNIVLNWLLKLLFRCEFVSTCRYYDVESYTCNRGDQDFCGAYKSRKYGKVMR